MARSIQPYGLWTTPIAADIHARRGSLRSPAWDGETLAWVETQSDNAWPAVLAPGTSKRSLTAFPKTGGKVGYGGGDLTAGAGFLVFASGNGQLFRTGLDGSGAKALTPSTGGCAAPAISPDGRFVAYVHSDGKTDSLALTDLDGDCWPVQLAKGADFYMQPAWHPATTQMAWIEWDQPNMPWDGTRLMLATFDPANRRLGEPRQVAGGGEVACQQPCFSPDGRWLAFIREAGEWQDLCLVNMESGDIRVLLAGEGYELMRPAWVQGCRAIGWDPQSRFLWSLRYEKGFTSLWRIPLTGSPEKVEISGYHFLSDLIVSAGGAVAFLGSSSQRPEELLVLREGELSSAARTENEAIPSDYLPEVQPLEWRDEEGNEVHGLYYPPANPHFAGNGRPPAILSIHGGPTSAAVCGFNSGAAHYCGKGYGYLEVNYRGSTGYGRRYRNGLRGNWGLVDRLDAVSGAKALVDQKLADGRKLVIRGGSAGGYTVYNALIHHPGVFKAGISLYGVANLFSLNMDTHKFEARYNDLLVGSLPEAANRFQEWSPVFHAARIQDRLAIFQGSDDKVVPQAQSDEIAAALQASGTPVTYKVYPGEGHGFRKTENILDCQKETERFLMVNVLFAV